MNRAVLIFSLIMAMSFHATASCQETLTKCDLAVHALQADNEALRNINDLQSKQIDEQQIVINENSRWYRTPEIIIPLTILATLIGVHYAK